MKHQLTAVSLAAFVALNANAQNPPGTVDNSGRTTARTNNLGMKSPDLQRAGRPASTTNVLSGSGQLGAVLTNSPTIQRNQIGSATNQGSNELIGISTRTNTTGGAFQNGSSDGDDFVERSERPDGKTLQSIVRQTVSTELSQLGGAAYSGEGGVLPVRFEVREGGIVEMTGTVPKDEEKDRIETIVKRIPGVSSVENYLRVSDQAGAVGAAVPSSGSSAEMPVAGNWERRTGASTTNTLGLYSTNRLWPTSTRTNSSSRNYASTNRAGGSDTNLFGPARTNATQRKFELPSGLQHTNSSGAGE